MVVEQTKNRDIFIKFSFMNFLNCMLMALGIDEEIIEIESTEQIYFKLTEMPKIFNRFLDFKAITKSGKILIFEFKKDTLRTVDLKQVFDYYVNEFTKTENVLEAIIISLSDKGRITNYTESQLTHNPQIIKTKKINKQKDLKNIRNKLKNDKKLTIPECALLITLPLFDIKESEEEITEEVCHYIKNKKHCIPDEKLDEMIIAMYLNIIEYIPDRKKQEKLMKMIKMAEKTVRLIESIKNEGYDECKMQFIKNALRNRSVDEIAEILCLSVSEVQKYVEM
ncbi:hypothetical protein [Methanobrevibacter sp.]